MTEIAENETIISAQLKSLVECGIQDIVITTGYFNDVLVEYCNSLQLPVNIEYVYNPLFNQTNYIYSIYCAYESLRDDDVILMHGDMVFELDVLKKAISNEESCMTVSSTVALPQKDFKVVLKEGKIVAVGIEFFDHAVAAQPLYKLLKKDWMGWLEKIREFCVNGKTTCYAENAWNEIADTLCVRPLDVKDALCNEIDNYEDLCVVSERYKVLT